MAYNVAPPALNLFGKLSRIGDSITEGRERRKEAELEAQRKEVLSRLTAGDDYGTGISRLLSVGDLEGAAKVAGISKDLSGGGITPYQAAQLEIARQRLGLAHEEAEARRGQPKVGGTVESIRAKLASGENLSPQEKQVYEDALRADPMTRLLMGLNQQGAGESQVSTPGIPYVAPVTPGGTAPERGEGGPASANPRVEGPAQGIPTVNSVEEAMALPPGTKFRTPDGREKVR